MDERQLCDLSGNPTTCKVREDTFEITWPDGAVLKGKAPQPWDAVLKVLDRPHHSLLQRAIESLCATRSA